MVAESKVGSTLKRELGTLESYAVLIGILVGAGIFRVTSEATAATGPSVILAHILLAPVILATSVAYQVFLSTPLGLRPGGEILHIRSTFGSARLAFLAAWLKLVSYLGAGAYLANALAINLLELVQPGGPHGATTTLLVALATMLVFLAINLASVRWFGRIQVAMCFVLAIALVILIVPGLFAVEVANYQPFFTGGLAGFSAALPPLFFAYAGFEALSQAAGEVQDSRDRLPRIFARGILATALLFLAMSVVALGVLPASELGTTGVPMSRAAATYLPFGAAKIVTLGAVMAVATSLNATIFVPARLSYYLAREGLLPDALARVHATRRTPVFGLVVCSFLMAALLMSGHMGLALGIAVVALMLLYGLHSLALILLPRLRPELYAEARVRVPRSLQLGAAWTSVLALGALVSFAFAADIHTMRTTEAWDRYRAFDLTSLELLVLWVAVGLALYQWTRARART